MKVKRAALSLALGLASANLFAFEGVVEYQVNSGKKSMPLGYSIKDKKYRMDFENENHKASMINDGQNIYMLMSERKMAMKMDPAKFKPRNKKGKPEGKLSKTGRSETIAGQKAQEWLWESKAAVTEIWASEDMGSFMGSQAQGGQGQGEPQAWEEAVKGKALFPLKVKSRKGKPFEMLATKVAPQSLSDELFVVPKGYKIIEGMGAMMGSMKPDEEDEGAPSTAAKVKPGKPGGRGQGRPGMDMQEMMKKMMNASPEEREKMMKEMQSMHGGQ